jgi:hypothetical protein
MRVFFLALHFKSKYSYLHLVTNQPFPLTAQ